MSSLLIISSPYCLLIIFDNDFECGNLSRIKTDKSMTEKTRKSLKPVGTRPGVINGSWKVHEASVGNCPPFWPLLSTLIPPTYKRAKLLVPILKPLTTNEFTVKDSFHFAEEIVDQ